MARILHVEDDTAVRHLLLKYLSAHGHSVTSVREVAEARLLVSKVEYDVVISDANVDTRGDGIEWVASLGPKDPPAILYCTLGYNQESPSNATHIPKPELAQLTEAIDRLWI